MSRDGSGRRAAQNAQRQQQHRVTQHHEDTFRRPDRSISDDLSGVPSQDLQRSVQMMPRTGQPNIWPSQGAGVFDASSSATSASGTRRGHSRASDYSDSDAPFRPAPDLLFNIGAWTSERDPWQGRPGHIVPRSAYPGNVRPPTSPPENYHFDLNATPHPQAFHPTFGTPAQHPYNSGTPPGPAYMYSWSVTPPASPPVPSDSNIATEPHNQAPSQPGVVRHGQALSSTSAPQSESSLTFAGPRPTHHQRRVERGAPRGHERRRRASRR